MIIKHDVTAHEQYEQACRLMEERGSDPKWIRMNSDVRAVVDYGCWFHEKEAKRVIDLFPLLFTHHKGKWAGKPFKLEQWQKDWVVAPLFGWRRPAAEHKVGYRRFREGLLAIPRKNGKSILIAGLGWIFALTDNPKENAAEVFCVAADKEQGSKIYEFASAFRKYNRVLEDATNEYATRALLFPSDMSVLRVLSSVGETKHGSSPHAVLADELHAWGEKMRETHAAMTTGSGAREQAFIGQVSTAGIDRLSICGEQWEYAERIIDGTLDDPNFLPILYAAEADDDWTSEETWRKANPNLGVSIGIDFLRTQCEKAQNLPSEQNNFRRLYLNQWTQQDSRFIDMATWDNCKAADIEWFEQAA